MDNDVVWLHEHRRFGFLKILNTTHSLVAFETQEYGWVMKWVENDDYDLWEERTIEYEPDE